MHKLTILPIFFNLQLQDAESNDCTGGDLQGNIAVYLYVVAVLRTHLRLHMGFFILF